MTYEIAGPFRTDSTTTTTTTTTTTATTPPTTTTTTTSTTTTSTTPSSGITLMARGYKVKGVQHTDLIWSGATTTNIAVTRNGATTAITPNDGAYTDNIGKKGKGTYAYQLSEPNGGPPATQSRSCSPDPPPSWCGRCVGRGTSFRSSGGLPGSPLMLGGSGSEDRWPPDNRESR